MPPADPTAATPLRVLVIDDHADACESLTVLLSLHGHDARGVTGGFSAFHLASEFRPDVCLVDVRMPVMDGYAVAARLREMLGPEVRLIAVTGELTAASDPRAVVFDRVFTKPLDVPEMLRAVAAGTTRQAPS